MERSAVDLALLREKLRGEDMPRERLARCGAAALRDEELLAVVLGTGYRGRHVLEVATAIFAQFANQELVELDLVQWRRIKGVGKVKAAQLVAAFELARRGLGKGLGTRPVVASPVDALPLLEEIRDQRR